MGVFVLLIIVLSFTAGTLRRELVLTLTGAVFLAAWVYCLVMTLLLAVIHRRRAATVSIRLSPEKLTAGGWTQVLYSEREMTHHATMFPAHYATKFPAHNKKVFQFPGILVRCRIHLSTRDGRIAAYSFKPEQKSGLSQQETFQVEKRGAYFSAYDEFAVFDILGLFDFAFRIPQAGARLLVSPHAAIEPVPVEAQGGNTERHDRSFERSDNLIDHRPYVPGDDPRRINWKLYGHGGELILREGEREPPPHSNMIIFIDTQYDELYTAKSARYAVDLLCENALAAACAGKEKDVQTGFTGQSEKTAASLTSAELGFFLARPWACPWTNRPAIPLTTPADLPAAGEGFGIAIFALPRIYARGFGESSALDRFISNNANRAVKILFIYGIDKNEKDSVFAERAEAAERCVSIYNRRSNVRAQAISVIAK
ncbi:MAG: DUF58 domain-containing protein [Treponema sp.]|nr:DUF58 domain-containing protein [Treponema sp.]